MPAKESICEGPNVFSGNSSELLLEGAQGHMDVETSLSASEGTVIVQLDVGEVIPPWLLSATRYRLCLLAQRTLGL